MIATPLSMFSIIENEDQRNELAVMYEQNLKMFYSIALKILKQKQDAEDAVQNAFISIADNPDLLFNVAKENRIKYIKTVIRNASYRIWNKKNKAEINQDELDDDMIDESTSLEEYIVGKCSCDDIYKFIDTLSEETQTALYLKLHFGMKNADIARQLCLTDEAVKKRIERATAKIRKYAEDYNND